MSDLELRADGRPRPPRRVPTIALALTLAVMGTAVSLVVLRALRAAPDGPIRLAVSLGQGDEFSYRMTMALDGTWDLGGQEMPMDLRAVADMDYRVEEVEPDGVMVLDLSVRLVEMSVGGLSVPDAPPPVRGRVRVAPDGMLLEAGEDLAAAPGMPSQQGGLDSLFPSLPEEAVQPGDTWEIEEEVPFPLGDGVVIERGAGRFLRYERTHGVTAAVLERRTTSSIDASASPGTLAGLPGGPNVPGPGGTGEELLFEAESHTTMLVWVDPSGGELLRSESEASVRFRMRAVGAASGVPMIGFHGDASISFERR